MIFACQISWALVPASHLSHKRSRTAGECLLYKWPTQLSIHSSQQLPCISTPSRNGYTFCPTFGTQKKSHQNKCSFHRDICRGQTSNRGHVQPTLASESRFAGSAGMLSSTVLVSTATTPTGIPPSLVTCETNQNLQDKSKFVFLLLHN